MKEGVLDKVPEAVEILVVVALVYPVSLWGGITGFIPCLWARSRMALVSYPLSARRFSAPMPSIRWIA